MCSLRLIALAAAAADWRLLPAFSCAVRMSLQDAFWWGSRAASALYTCYHAGCKDQVPKTMGAVRHTSLEITGRHRNIQQPWGLTSSHLRSAQPSQPQRPTARALLKGTDLLKTLTSMRCSCQCQQASRLPILACSKSDERPVLLPVWESCKHVVQESSVRQSYTPAAI